MNTPTPTPTPPAYSAAFLDQHRDWNVTDFDWWEGVYDDFKEDMAANGIFVDKMYFSGFSSQGDGACFEGHIQDLPLFLSSHALGYPKLALLLKHTSSELHMHWVHTGRYYHENSLSFDADYHENFLFDQGRGNELVTTVLELQCDGVAEESDAFIKENPQLIRHHCQTLYASLEAEYDYLTSDETLTETLRNNDIEEPIEVVEDIT
jgi:hypothetical protein